MHSHSLFAAPFRVFYSISLFLLLICFIFAAFSPTVALAQDFTTSNHLGEVCFAIADERETPENPDDHQDTLTLLDPETAATQVIGLTGTENVESMSFGPDLQLYAADGGQLGIVDPMTGDFTATSQPFGQVNGSLGGNFTIGDVDGLAYSLDRNILFGTQRRNDSIGPEPRPDFLFAIDPTTGAHIENYFGPNTDYVLVPPVLDEGGVPLNDVDDLQFNPVTGVLFGVMNTDGRDGVLVIIDVDTGASTPIAALRYEGSGEIIDDIEGMSFSNDGTLYVSTGDNFTGDADDLNRLFEIDPTTGQGHLIGPFPTTPKDYEALACLSSEAAIVLKKYTNGPGQAPDDADVPTGPEILVGAPVTWTFVFTNTSVLTLTNLSLVDNKEGSIGPSVDCLPAGTLLGPGESLTCVATGIALEGQYDNLATITGDSVPHPLYPTHTVTDINPSHYFGRLPGISIIKFTNGEDADTPTGPFIPAGDPVTWTYEVRNTTDVPLSNVTVVDNIPGVTPVYVSGDTNSNGLLEPAEVWLFQATGTAEPGQYANIGTTTGVPPQGPPVTDTNPSHYFGSEPGIEIIKFTNGEDADTPTGPVLAIGDPVTWTYEVRNTGNVPLSDVTVTDNIPGVSPVYVSGDLNIDTLLDLDEVWLFRATGTAESGQYANIGTTTGIPPVGPPVTDTNPSHYFASGPGIEIIKFTNGEDADTPTGPVVEVGDPVTWTYEVRNTGDVPLSAVTVTDNIPGVTPVFVSGDTNGNGLLDLDEVWLFQATGIAVAGQYANIGTTTGVPPVGPPVTDTNPSHYFASGPGIEIIKFTNGPGQAPEDADTPTGPLIDVGDPVTWTYEVRNTGNVPLSDVTVTDNITGVSPVYVSGDLNNNALLDLDEVWLFRATGIAEPGQYANIGTVVGTPPTGPNVTDTNPSHYFGLLPEPNPGISIIKFTNGEDADTPTGPTVPVGDQVTWTYEVRNTGDVPLSNVTVVDNIPGVSPAYVSGDDNTNSLLDLDEVWLYEATGTAVPGQYANLGTTTGVPPVGPPVTDTNPSHYFGSGPGIAIIKFTNDEDADSPTGPVIQVGDPVTWTYEVRNTGNVALSEVAVTDNIPGVSPVYINGDTNNNSLLDLEEIWLFQATGVAETGQYENIGTTTGTPPSGPPVTDTNPSHYFGINPGIEIIKFTNGPGQAPEDADTPTGPEIEIGDTVTWTYEVRNTGDVPLSNVTVTDNVPGVNPVYVDGDENNDSLLDLDEVWLFRALGVAVGGQYENIGTVVGTPPSGPNVTDTNPSHYFGDDEGPTNLPGGEQPQQDRRIFLPSVRAEEN